MSSDDKGVNRETDASNTETEAENEAKKETTKKQFGPLSVQAWDDIVGQRIAQAMKDGEFDNLPGKGKPQQLRDNTYAGDNHLAFDVMQNNDITPGWIERRKKVRTRIDHLRTEIQTQTSRYKQALTAVTSSDGQRNIESEWLSLKQQWAALISELNAEIQNANIEQPIDGMEIFTIRLEEELAKVGL